MALRPASALLATLAAFACDGGLEPEPICGSGFVGACGMARFSGTPPATTDAVYLVAFPTFPDSCADLLVFPPKFRPFPPFELPSPYPDSVAYGLEIAPDRYEWVVAVWKDTGTVTFTVADTAIFRVAGYYRDPADTTQPGVVTVPNGGGVGDVNVAVDFDNRRPVSDYVACGP
jgi:hypothetical protein